MKDCKYPNCTECDKDDCEMELFDLQAILKRRRYNREPQKYRDKQNEYRNKKKTELPICNECEYCILVQKEKQDGHRRLCIKKMRLVEQKVTNSPQWCGKRTPSKDYLKRKEQMLKHKKEKYDMNK